MLDLKNMKLTGDIISLVNTLLFQREKLNIGNVIFFN